MELQNYDTSKRFVATVTGSERLTPIESKEEVRDIGLQVKGFHARVGQNLGVLAPGRRELGQEHHFRLYSVADVPVTGSDGVQRFSICVRRCTYLDPFSGEAFPGVASNYLCDLSAGDTLTITGPYDHAFTIPNNDHANLILIGAGTGIAPFRAFVKHLYAQYPRFAGRVILFHGAHTGLDLLYRNDKQDDFALYYDRDTFEAIDALSNRPGWSDAIDWEAAFQSREETLCSLLSDPNTHVYVAGLRQVLSELDYSLARIFGSPEAWEKQKSQLESEQRWAELLY